MTNLFTERFENVTAQTKANVYFDGKVVSHTIVSSDGVKRTLGLIYPGTYTFNTKAAERMSIIAGSCRVRQNGQGDWKSFASNTEFQVPADSSFDIQVDSGIAEYICEFLS